MLNEKPTIVVVGNGMVGYKFCEKLVAKTDAFQIVVFGEEPRPAYDRVHLSEYFSGKTADDLLMNTLEWYNENKITLHLNDPVQEINREAKTVHSLKGAVLKYDYLVLATGSSAFVPDIPGVESAEHQVQIAARKAGIPHDTPVKLWRFRVERFREAKRD